MGEENRITRKTLVAKQATTEKPCLPENQEQMLIRTVGNIICFKKNSNNDHRKMDLENRITTKTLGANKQLRNIAYLKTRSKC